MRSIVRLIFIFLVAASPALSAENGLTVKGVRHFSYTAFTRVVFEIEAAAPYVLTRTSDGRGVLFSAYDGPLTVKSALPLISDGVISGMEVKEDAGKQFIVIRLDSGAGEVKDFVLRGPDRIVLDIAKKAAPSAPAGSDKGIVIVLDPGHGGRDSGIVSSRGQEKSITQDLAVSIKKNLQKDQRFKIVLTRDRDVSLTNDDRAAAANSSGAKVFIAIHAAPGSVNRVYVQDPGEEGEADSERPVTKDFLSFEAGNERQENLWRRQQAGHARESIALGRAIAGQLGSAAEPVQAPIAELRAVDAAAVMVEAGMEADRTRTAADIVKGIEQYVRENR